MNVVWTNTFQLSLDNALTVKNRFALDVMAHVLNQISANPKRQKWNSDNLLEEEFWLTHPGHDHLKNPDVFIKTVERLIKLDLFPIRKVGADQLGRGLYRLEQTEK